MVGVATLGVYNSSLAKLDDFFFFQANVHTESGQLSWWGAANSACLDSVQLSGFSARIICKCLDTEIMSALADSSLKLIFGGEIFRLPSALLLRLKIEIFFLNMKAFACPRRLVLRSWVMLSLWNRKHWYHSILTILPPNKGLYFTHATV